MKKNYVVLDLETQRTFEEIGSRNFAELGVSVCCLYTSYDQRYHHFLEKDLSRMENFLIDADLIVGFNHRKFDLPVLQPYFTCSVSDLPMFDILEDLTQKLGHRIGLDSVAQATLNVGKSSSGLEAIRYFREGRWQELIQYCENDVKITKDVFEYGLEKGEVFYLTRDGAKKIRVEVDWLDQVLDTPKNAIPAQYKLL